MLGYHKSCDQVFLFFFLGSQRPPEKRFVAGQSLRGEPLTAFEEGTRHNRFWVSLSIIL